MSERSRLLSIIPIVRKRSAYNQPDPVLVREQLAALQAVRRLWGDAKFLRFFFWILKKVPDADIAKTENFLEMKEGTRWNKRLVPFSPNKVQQDIIARAKLRNICLKMRQGGYTTLFLLWRLCLNCFTDPGTNGFLIAQTGEYATKHFATIKRSYKYFAVEDPFDETKNDLAISLKQNLLRTSYSNKKEIILSELDSRIMIGSAEVEEVGQGVTLQHLVASEVARYKKNPEETLANVKEAIVPGGTFDIESTANEQGGYYYEEVRRAADPKGKSEFQLFFHEWWWIDEYTSKIAAEEDSLTEEELAVMKKAKLDLNRIAWRREKKISLRHNFDEKYPEDPVTAFLVRGHSFFDKTILRLRRMEIENFKPVATLGGGDAYIFIRPNKSRRYLIGADPATGRAVTLDTTDFSAAVVIDMDSGEEVAAYRARVAPEEFAADLAELGRYYNNALVAVERTGDGGTVMLAMQGDCKYFNIYKHKEWWKRDKKTKTVIEVEGYPTSVKTRPLGLNRVAAMVRDYPEKIWDIRFIDEALAFVRDEKGKPAAAVGEHDDTVLCRAIGHMTRLIVLGYFDPLMQKGEAYGADDHNLNQFVAG